MKKHLFSIPIGDWSGDGHSQCIYYYIESNKPIDDVREAYFKAKKKLPEDACPENICSQCEENWITQETIDALKVAGYPDDELTCNNFDGIDDFIEILLWFIEEGDPDLELDIIELDTLPFYGFDENGRHIGFLGYGLFD